MVFTPRRNFTANEYPELFRMARAQLYKPGDPRLGPFLDPPALDAAVVDNGSESSADGAGDEKTDGRRMQRGHSELVRYLGVLCEVIC